MVRLNESQPSPQNQPVSPTITQPSTRPRRRTFYFLVGLIAIAALVSIFALVYLLPKGEAESVAVGLNYSVGEKMTYEYTISESMMGHTIAQNGTITMEVLSFDGENYTLRETMSIQFQQFSYMVKMNKTGYLLDYGGLPTEFGQTYGSLSGMPGFGLFFQKDEESRGDLSDSVSNAN